MQFLGIREYARKNGATVQVWRNEKDLEDLLQVLKKNRLYSLKCIITFFVLIKNIILLNKVLYDQIFNF